MPRRVFDTFVESREIARAFRNVVPVGASPDPAVVVPLQEIPDHAPPSPRSAAAVGAASFVHRFGRIVSHDVGTVNRKTLTRAKRNQLPIAARPMRCERMSHARFI
jgi:hypothetical protein